MYRRIRLFTAASILLTGLVALPARPLFDGRSLDGWSIENGGRFSVRDGLLHVDGGAGWLRSAGTYADFTLTVEVRFLAVRANSGIFVRTGPTSHADAKGYPDHGYQVQCMDDTDGARPLASLIPYGGPLAGLSFDREAIKRVIRPTGEWNTIEITCRGEVLVSRLNGVEVSRGYGVGRRDGHVGIQGEGGRLDIRRIDLTEHASGPLQADGAELALAGAAAHLIGPGKIGLFHRGGGSGLNLKVNLTGPQAGAFRLDAPAAFTLAPGAAHTLAVFLRAGPEQTGVMSAWAEITDESGTLLHVVGLHGLSTPGLEGKREPPLKQVFEALGHSVEPGWDTLAGNINPAPMGTEVRAQRFRAAGPGDIEMRPVARYSPDFLLPFGFYPATSGEPRLHVVGTLARATPDRPEQNILHPRLASGTTRFTAPSGEFGLFTASPSHVAYTEETLNARLEPKHAAHAVRVYPARDRVGQSLLNTYLVCFEEASNGDYQDYVFLLRNVEPVQ